MDERLLDLINGNLAGRSGFVDSVAVFLAGDAIFVLAALAVICGLVELRRAPKDGIRVGSAACLAGGVATLCLLVVSSFVYEPRPFVADASDTIQLIAHSADNSFPSDHATYAALIATVASVAWTRWSPLFIGLAVLVGCGRIIAGVHYPADVAAGWLIGASAGAIGWYIVRYGDAIWTRWSNETA